MGKVTYFTEKESLSSGKIFIIFGSFFYFLGGLLRRACSRTKLYLRDCGTNYEDGNLQEYVDFRITEQLIKRKKRLNNILKISGYIFKKLHACSQLLVLPILVTFLNYAPGTCFIVL